jgi:hypothetical protein
VIFDARRTLGHALEAKGHLDQREGECVSEQEILERFPRADARDVACDEGIAVLQVYVDLVAASQDAADRYSGVAAHLAACGPCNDDFAGLLAAVTSERSET